uniref:Uncharacterized protein n=1 Tax=Rhizobium leguminosarum bv. viciae TaxID=387 RepID=A0A0U3I6B7_RHILV|nr:hypothetical protein [Rhizobium leguminosarum bv. viciae]
MLNGRRLSGSAAWPMNGRDDGAKQPKLSTPTGGSFGLEALYPLQALEGI